MARYRLVPTPAQQAILARHCAHARYVWNLAAEQQSWWRPGRSSAPGYCAQAAQLTQARVESDWLADGSQMVQQQALRDFAQAKVNYFAGTHGRPTWRKAGRNDGFRIVAVRPGRIRRLTRSTGEVWIPKAGWVRFRWSRAVPAAKSYRVTLDRMGRWHIAFAAGRVGRVGPAYTSQQCSACGHIAAESRESQALFRCVACGYVGDADVNAAENIAAGHAATARGRSPLGGRTNREPQPLLLSA